MRHSVHWRWAGRRSRNTRTLCIWFRSAFIGANCIGSSESGGGSRKPYGGTISMGLKRGSWVQHPKYGLTYVGGTLNGRISLHDMQTGKRLTQNAKVSDCQRLCTAAWRVRAKAG